MSDALKHKLWAVLLFVFIVKVIYAFFIYFLASCNSPDRILQLLAIPSGDHTSYINPVIHFFEKGSYVFQNTWGQNVYAGRLPVYGLCYYLLNLISFGNGFTLLALVQLGLESFAICFFSRHLLGYPGMKSVAFLFFILMVISANQTYWSLKIQPESLATSLLIILAVLFDQKRWSGSRLLLIGVLLFILIAFKPYFGIILIPFCWIIAFGHESLWNRLKRLILICLPIVLFIVPWTVRNMEVTGEPILLTEPYSGYAYTKSELALRNLGATTGIGWVPWDNKNFGHYMSNENSTYQLPAFFEGQGWADSLQSIRLDYIEFRDCCEQNNAMDDELGSRIESFENDMIEKEPYRVKLLGPVRHLFSFTFHSGTWYYPVAFQERPCGNIFSDGDKLLQSFLYYMGLFLLIPGFFFLYKSRLKRIFVFGLIVVGFVLIFFPFIIKYVELRYFIQTYPFAMMATAVIIAKIARLGNTL